MAAQESIYDLFARVREHPDFVAGTIWTPEDIARVVFEPAGGWGTDGPSEEDLARVTPEMRKEAAAALRFFLFDQMDNWWDALRDQPDHSDDMRATASGQPTQEVLDNEASTSSGALQEV